MNKKGFTLIELLAVILVLALVVTITMPIVSNLTSKSKKTIYENDIKLYAESIKKAVLAYEIEYKKTPTTLSQIKEFLKKDGNNVECDTVIIYNSDSVYLEKCTVDSKLVKDYTYGQAPVCTLASDSEKHEKEIGAKYECEVRPGDSFVFYILSHNEDGTTNLIMDNNICENGTEATLQNICTVKWISAEDYNDDDKFDDYCGLSGCANTNKGPITAMNHLYNATKDWTNIPNIIIDYQDENLNLNGTKEASKNFGYGSIQTNNKTTKITMKDGTATATYTNLKARLPRYDEVFNVPEITYEDGLLLCKNYNSSAASASYNDSCPSWLSINLRKRVGYWTLSTYNLSGYQALRVVYGGFASNGTVNVETGADENGGIRPVITVHIK